jgi:hypothetical protein
MFSSKQLNGLIMNAALMVLLHACNESRGQEVLAESVQVRYREALQVLEDRCAHSRVTGVLTQEFYQRDVQTPQRIDRVCYVIETSGEKRQVRTTFADKTSNLGSGTERVDIHDGVNFRRIIRSDEKAGFQIAARKDLTGVGKENMDEDVQRVTYACCATNGILNTRLMSSPDFLIESAREVEKNGDRLYEVVFRTKLSDQYATASYQGTWWLLPEQGWNLAEYTFARVDVPNGIRCHGSITYRRDAHGKLRHPEQTEQTVSLGTFLSRKIVFAYEKWESVQLPARAFSLASYGLGDFENRSRRVDWMPWVWLGLGMFCLAGAIGLWRRQAAAWPKPNP